MFTGSDDITALMEAGSGCDLIQLMHPLPICTIYECIGDWSRYIYLEELLSGYYK